MTDKRLRILRYCIAFLTAAAVAFLYPGLPEQIPTNWGFNGEVSYSSKNTIWIITVILILLAFLYDFLPYIDPRRRNYLKFGKIYDFLGVALQFFLAVMIGIILCESYYPGRIETFRVIFVMIALLFLLIGNYLPKIQSNFYMGIKTPWTLSSDEVWRKTHRLAGKLYVGCGILLFPSAAFLPSAAAGTVLFVLAIGSSLIVTLASYLWWKKLE